MSLWSEQRQMLRALSRQGFTIEQRKSSHYKVVAPDRSVMFVGHSPSDYRALRNFRAWAKRHGGTFR